MALPRSEILGGRYRVERELGRGGMATVYLAHDDTDGSQVALKLLHSELAVRVGLSRFTREIQIAAHLRHPGIIPVLDTGEHHGLPYFTMPVITGETLQQALARRRHLPVSEAVQLACEVADALQHAHTAGVVHRDIKPSNILLSGGHALLADFGVARANDVASFDKLTETGVTVGTAAYMSPEQASADHIDGRSDLYSLACVLYEMLAGGPPFSGATTQAILARHAVDPVPNIRTVRSTVGPALAAAIERALAKVPADRFPDAASFAEALRDAERNPGTMSAPALAARPPRGPRMAVAAAFILGAAAVTTLMTTRSRSALDPNRVVGFPLEAPTSIGGMEGAGEDVATLIGSALDKRGAIRWVDGWRLLSAEQRRAGGTGVDAASARAIARANGAGYYVTGRVVLRGDSADVLLELVDVAFDSVVLRPRASGSPKDLWRASLGAVNALLPRLVPGGEARDLATAWRDRAPAAVASFLAAEAAFRRAQPGRALALYRDAVLADSLFALAAVRGAQAATWDHRPSEAAVLVRAALGKPMAPQYAHYTNGYAAYLGGAADSAVAEFQRAVALDPEFAAGWMQLGETYIHLVPATSDADSAADVAFARARAIDPTAIHALIHPIEMRLRSGDVGGAAPMLARFLSGAPDSAIAEQLRVSSSCVRDGPARTDWAGAVRRQPLGVVSAGLALAGRGGALACAAAAFEAVLAHDTVTSRADAHAERQGALLGLAATLVAHGRDGDLPAHVAASVARGDGGSSLLMLGASVSATLDPAAARVAQADAVRFGDDFARCSTDERCAILAVYGATHGRATATSAIAGVLAARATADTASLLRLLAAATAAHAALARGDSARARELFRALVSRPLPPGSSFSWDPGGALAIERLTYARLLLAHGEAAAARRAADALDASAPISFVLVLRASLELRVTAATAMGDTRAADAYRRRLANLSPPRAAVRS